MWSWKLIDANAPVPVSAAEAKSDGSTIGARSSHGCSVCGDTLFMLGGEIVARTPVDSTIWSRKLTESSEWAPVEVKGDTTLPARVAHAQAVVADDLYVFGGRQSIAMEEAPLDDLWKFSLKDRSWSAVSSKGGKAPPARSFHKMLSIGSKLYVFGGCAASGRLADLHCYDTETATWEFLSDPPAYMAGRGGAGFVASCDGKSLFVVGGFIGEESNAVYRFDLESKQWEVVLAEKNDKVRPFSVSVGVTLPGKLVFFGGEIDPSTKGHEGAGSFSNDVVVLDSKTGLPLEAKINGDGDEPAQRGWASGANWGDNRLVVYGGLSGSDKEPVRLADTWVLEFSSQ